MWNNPDQDGVNGNEKDYQENTELDISRYKLCFFNGPTLLTSYARRRDRSASARFMILLR